MKLILAVAIVGLGAFVQLASASHHHHHHHGGHHHGHRHHDKHIEIIATGGHHHHDANVEIIDSNNHHHHHVKEIDIVSDGHHYNNDDTVIVEEDNHHHRHHHHRDRDETIVVKEGHRHHHHHHGDCGTTEVRADRVETSVHKGKPEIVMHHQPTLIVRRPPTTVRINHAPLIVKAKPIMFHRSADVTHHTTVHKHLKPKVHVRPVVVKVVKPIEKKVFIERRREETCGCPVHNGKCHHNSGCKYYGVSVESDNDSDSASASASDEVEVSVESGSEESCGCNK